MTISLMLLIAVLAGAVTSAVYVLQLSREHREMLKRASLQGEQANRVTILSVPKQSAMSRLADWLRRHAPDSWSDAKDIGEKLVQAGFDDASAPVVYSTSRLVALALPLLLVIVLGPHDRPARLVLLLMLALAMGLLAPPALVDRSIRLRQLRLRRALPDSLDLLVVCVEAGVSLDAAILRVAREMEILHPDLSKELLIVNRKINAGVPREAALHGLWTRTGVEELRSLGSSMIQSEKWGTSVARVLRVYAESLRRKRKQHAEQAAAKMSVKMLFPLTCFIFPALFVVMLGPAAIKIFQMFMKH